MFASHCRYFCFSFISFPCLELLFQSPEYYPTAPYERGYGEEKSYLGGEERGGPSARRGGERRDEGFLAKTFHEIERAVGGIGGGAAAAIGGRAATRSITSTTRYPLCLRTLLKPRPDIRDSKLEGDIIMVRQRQNRRRR